MQRLAVTLALLWLLPLEAGAQDSVASIPPVVVTARGPGSTLLDAPFAVTSMIPDSVRPGQRHAALDESLSLVPGLAAATRSNPSQDPRLSIRGFGSRSAFGVRGVRVLRDGMPLTLPDGQTPVDYLSLESVGRIDVIRGAASALYGNASGGVIDIRTAAPPAVLLAFRAQQWLGSDRYRRSAVAGGGTAGRAFYQADLALTQDAGFRNHARQQALSGFARMGLATAGGDYSLQVLGLDMPLAENPGAVTLDELRSDPRVADPLSIRRNARKEVRQFQAGVSMSRIGEAADLSLSAHVGGRSLNNPLPFAIVDIGRMTFGASARAARLLAIAGSGHRVTAGFDFQAQNDARRNFVNCVDTVPLSAPTAGCPSVAEERGAITLDQREIVSGLGVFLADELALSRRFRLHAGGRADRVRFEVRDNLAGGTNPDDSGVRAMHAVTPFLALVSRIAGSHSVYASLSAAFETPTATELGNQPDGSAGLNPDLRPQRSLTREIGARGARGNILRYDVAVFATDVRDELVPFEIPGSGGRRYFRNAGRTGRRGAEAGLLLSARVVSLAAAYSHSRFRFLDYSVGGLSYSGARIPGIPVNRLQSSLTWAPGIAFVVLEAESVAGAFADDANTIRAPGYELMHLRAGTRGLGFGSGTLAFSAGIRNLFDRTYSPSLAVNAARGRFFEPAPGRSFFLGGSVEVGSRTP